MLSKKMDLDESINNLKRLVELRKNKCGEIKFDTCICGTKDLETVLQELENLKEECRQYREFIIATGGKDIEDITSTQYVRIQQEGYIRGRKEEQEKAKQFIEENSIPKKKIEDKIKELKDKIKQNEKELRKKPEPVGSGFGSFDEYFKWRYKVIHENELSKEEIKDIQELLEEKIK